MGVMHINSDFMADSSAAYIHMVTIHFLSCSLLLTCINVISVRF